MLAKVLPIGNPGELLQRRPDIRAAERRLAAATERHGVATASLFPQVSLSGFVGFLAGRGSTFSPVTRRRSQSLPDCLGRPSTRVGRARVCAVRARRPTKLAAYEQTVLRTLEETENALAGYHAEQARLIRLNDQARESKRAADIARLRYKEGVIDFLSLLDAERTQLQAEDAVVQSESDVYVAVVALYKALGGVPA
jgi:outer membrane protein, multidrug efflux system